MSTHQISESNGENQIMSSKNVIVETKPLGGSFQFVNRDTFTLASRVRKQRSGIRQQLFPAKILPSPRIFIFPGWTGKSRQPEVIYHPVSHLHSLLLSSSTTRGFLSPFFGGKYQWLSPQDSFTQNLFVSMIFVTKCCTPHSC